MQQPTFNTQTICFLLLYVMGLCGGCASTESINNAKSKQIEEALTIASFITEPCTSELKAYFTRDNNKAFSLDPYDDYCAWGYGKTTLTEAKQGALPDSRFVLFAENNNIVWENNVNAYKNSVLGIAREYYKKREYDKALDEFSKLSKLNPDDWFIFHTIGWSYIYKGDFKNAEISFNNSLKLKQYAQNSFGLVEALLLQDKFDEAMTELNKTKYYVKDKYKNEVVLKEILVNLAKGDYAAALKITTEKPVVGVRVTKDPNGLFVEIVSKNSPASLCGLQRGDIIIEFDKIILQDRGPKFFINHLNNFKTGDYAGIKVLRDGRYYFGQIHMGITASLIKDYPHQYKLAEIELKNQKNS